MTNSHTQRLGLRKIVLQFFLSASLWLALFAVANAEVIRSFDADISINDDGSFFVTERIVYDFEQEQRHGMYRNVSGKHAEPASTWYKERYLDFQLESVTKDGREERFTLEKSGDELSLKIGDPNRTVTGSHTYEITYRVDGALVTRPDLTEIYWNVTGNEWEAPIEKATAKVSMTGSGAFSANQFCYIGAPGSTVLCDEIKSVSMRQVIFSTGRIQPGEEFTIAQELILPSPPRILERTSWSWIGLLGLFFWFVGGAVWIYRWRFAYRSESTVISQYEPYQDFKPMFTGVLIDNRLDTRDISAGIVYLAEQGFISIKETTEKVLFFFGNTDYEITLLRPISETETHFQKQLLKLLFSEATSVGEKIKLHELSANHAKQRANQKIIKALRKATVKDLVDQGFLEQRIKRVTKAVLVSLIGYGGWMAFVWANSLGFTEAMIILLTAVSGIAVLLLASERRTKKGYEALRYLKGFKEFLSVTEKERYKFHNAPSLSPQKFMEFLPYAIAFGVEKEWAKVFAHMQIAPPEWYSSSTGAQFNPVVFAANLSAFSNDFASSTGSSGSSGGGVSGGGSGGGGGGSW